MKSLTFDTNIILDIFFNRIPHAEKARKLIAVYYRYNIKICIPSNIFTDIYYLASKQFGHQKAIKLMGKLYHSTETLNVDTFTIYQSLHSKFNDFEDAVLHTASVQNNIDAIITRNQKDFTKSKIPVFSPEEFLSIIK